MCSFFDVRGEKKVSGCNLLQKATVVPATIPPVFSCAQMSLGKKIFHIQCDGAAGKAFLMIATSHVIHYTIASHPISVRF